MSIIADTLKRLQTRSLPTTSDVAEGPSRRSLLNQGEGAGRHRKKSQMKFWIIGGGMTVGLAGLAVSAFWIGLHLDFGLSTNTHARMDNRPPVPPPSLSSEMDGSIERAIAQLPPPPASQAKEVHDSQASIVSTDNSSAQDISSAQIPLESRLVVSQPEPPVSNETSEQQANSTSEQSGNTDSRQIEEPGESNSEESPVLEDLVDQPTPEVEPPHIVEMDIEEAQGPQIPDPMPLEEAFLHREELVETVQLSTNITPRPSSVTSMKELREPMNPVGQTTSLLQPSTANRLRHAQELIQTGNYEKAVVALSPLFHDPPVKWQPWFWMGTALLGQEDFEQADQFFLSGLARNDKIPQLWIQRALVAQQRGNYQLAIHELRQAESLDGTLPHIHLNMGYAYDQLGNDRLAKQYYEKFLKLSEGNPAFFSTRKKLFAGVIQQTQAERPSSPSVSSSLNP